MVPHLDMRSRTARLCSLLGLNRNVTVLAASIFALALGEELWQAYIPVYLTALGASASRRRQIRILQGSARQRLSISGRLAGRSHRTPPRAPLLHGRGNGWLCVLCDGTKLAIRLRRSPWGDGVEVGRVSVDIRRHRRLTAARAPRHRVQRAIDTRPGASGRRRTDRRTADCDVRDHRGYSRRPTGNTAAGPRRARGSAIWLSTRPQRSPTGRFRWHARDLCAYARFTQTPVSCGLRCPDRRRHCDIVHHPVRDANP